MLDVNRAFEVAVRRDPANWFWVHKRWKPRKFKAPAPQAGGRTGTERVMPGPRRILVRGVNWLGDAVMTTPGLVRLREALPDAHITLLTTAKLAEIWTGHPAIDAIESFAEGESAWSVRAETARQANTILDWCCRIRRVRRSNFGGRAFPNAWVTREAGAKAG